MSDNEENVLEDFSGMTQINGVTTSEPEHTIKNTENTENSEKVGIFKKESDPLFEGVKQKEIVFPQAQRPKFFDVLKSLGTTTLIIMGLVMLFLLFVGYKYLFSSQN